MYWQKRLERENPNKEIEERILKIRKNNPSYGYRRISAILRREGLKINKKKVQRICRKLKIQVKDYTRKSRKYNSYKGKVGKISKNRIKRRFKTNIVHQKITTDTTEFKYYIEKEKGKLEKKKLYLNPFMDMYNSEIISYEISKSSNLDSILTALKKAIEKTSDCKYRRTYHSDQGWAYQINQYRNQLKENKIYQSMSRKGNCLDNSIMENFFGILKQEIYYGKIYKSYEELKEAIEKYIKYYNEERIKSKLEYLSPVNYRIKNGQ